MVHTTRRRLLVVGGLAALTGCSASTVSENADETDTDGPSTTNGTEDETTSSPSTTESSDSGLEENFERALEAIPGTVDGTPAVGVFLGEPEPGEEGTQSLSMRRYATGVGLEPESVDAVALSTYGQAQTGGIISIVGNFDADEPDPSNEQLSSAEIHREDGRILLALETAQSGSSGWEPGLSAAKSALAGDAKGVLADDDVERVAKALQGTGSFAIFPEFPEATGNFFGGSEVSADGIDAFGMASNRVDEGTIEMAYAGLFEDGSTVDRETLRGVIPSTVTDELEFERDGRLLVATGRSPYVTSPDSGAGPDAHFVVRYDADTDSTTIRHRGEEPVAAEALTVTVDGEAVPNLWDRETVRTGDAVTVEAPPFTPVKVGWSDPDSDATAPLYRGVVRGREAIETDYDPEEDVVTFTYVGDRPAPTEPLELSHVPEDGERTEEPLSDRLETLEPGDEVTVEGVEYGDRVAIHASYQFGNASGSSSVVFVRPTPPGRFHLEREGPRIVYEGEESQPASDYRVTVEDGAAATQFADEFEDLTDGDALQLDAVPGDRVSVEWVGDPEEGPYAIREWRLEPDVSFDLRRDDGGLELAYASEDSSPADEFEVSVRQQPLASGFADQYDELSKGDAVGVDAEIYEIVVVNWTGDDEPMRVFQAIPAQLLDFEVDTSSSRPRIVFTGQGAWPTDAFRVRAEDETLSPTFGDGATFEKGDAVTVDVETGTEVSVEWTAGQEPTQVGSRIVHPAFEFDFEYDAEAGELTATSKTGVALDPERLTFLLYGDGERTYVDAFRKQYDSVTEGDSVTVQTPDGFGSAHLEHEAWNAWTEFEVED